MDDQQTMNPAPEETPEVETQPTEEPVQAPEETTEAAQ